MLANTDKPILKVEEDVLGVQKYIDGLSGFIRSCDTPLTIAIQGDWGSGKTSFMNMIRQQVGDVVVSVWFNTWQFSQFNLGNLLTINLLTALVDTLNKGENEASKVKECIGHIMTAGLKLGNGVLSDKLGLDIIDATKSNENLVETIARLKGEFQKCVDCALEKKKKDRLVVFIDDLDRLPPQRAVEVLEILKIFLDCEKCVFVLAIDYAVVCRGISLKYGEDFNEKKGRSFFDKIIQVPFKMPIAHYEIERYIEKAIRDMDFDTRYLHAYIEMVTCSIGYNPRSMKRLLNSFLLITMIYQDSNMNDPEKQVMLFAVLCLQMSYEPLYNAMVHDDNDVFSPRMLNVLCGRDEDSEDDGDACLQKFDELLEQLELNQENEEIRQFMQAFCNAVAIDGKRITTERFETLQSILTISGTTSSAEVHESLNNGGEGKGIRYTNTYDAEFRYIPISEAVAKNNSPTGWNGCIIDGFRLWGEDVYAQNLQEVVLEALARVYRKDPQRFQTMYSHAEEYGLRTLFYGSKKQNQMAAPRQIPGTEYQIETKNAYNDKVRFLKIIMQKIGDQPENLLIRAKLAHRVTIEP